ncbi:malate dehydrogenase, chloroplastic-like [Olea europaea var. sylvestris]|uniref:malate dehydrogenase, chloroplastic-like n=1 Tax=Olea europaea var. sylvestris TaxID=158386 RepID=UPI000C1D2614|nr:malate dehydrogenase, chloroplastic-like [Olea europaea var. sylvestris]
MKFGLERQRLGATIIAPRRYHQCPGVEDVVPRDYCFIPVVKDNPVTFTHEEVQEVTVRIQNAGTEVVEAKAGVGSATLSMAYTTARFVKSSIHTLDRDSDVYECCYVQSDLTYLPFFASRVKLGKNGAEAITGKNMKSAITGKNMKSANNRISIESGNSEIL